MFMPAVALIVGFLLGYTLCHLRRDSLDYSKSHKSHIIPEMYEPYTPTEERLKQTLDEVYDDMLNELRYC